MISEVHNFSLFSWMISTIAVLWLTSPSMLAFSLILKEYHRLSLNHDTCFSLKQVSSNPAFTQLSNYSQDMLLLITS